MVKKKEKCFQTYFKLKIVYCIVFLKPREVLKEPIEDEREKKEGFFFFFFYVEETKIRKDCFSPRRSKPRHAYIES